MWTIYDINGAVKAEAHELEYEGNFGGTRQVSLTISSPTPIEWAVTDYLVYRGETFTLRHLPARKKQARVLTSGEAFVYENMVFYSPIDELASVEFLDVVLEDNNLHYTALPTFDFYCETVQDLADRLQANLDRVYTGDSKWTVEVYGTPEFTPQSLSFSKQKCSQVLEMLANDHGVTYTSEGRTITINPLPITVAHPFKYGKGEGLSSIEMSGADDNELITRLRVYGSTRNLPHRYYNKLYRQVNTGEIKYFENPPENASLWALHISETMYLPNLMLPMFRATGADAYIEDAEKIAKYGLREGSVFFDGSGEEEEIYPTIEDMTAEILTEAGVATTATGNLDEVWSVENPTDNGVLPENGTLDAKDSYFSVWIKDVGFDINDYLTTETAQISMKSGFCAGRDFEIVECEKKVLLNATYYVLTCKRVVDNDIWFAFPNTTYPIQQGDKFVLLNIKMPETYVIVASQRLLEKGTGYYELNSQPNYVYNPEIDSVNALRKPGVAELLKEGKLMILVDDDLGITKSVRITSLKITEGEELAPQYEVTLSDKLSVSLADRVTQSVSDNIKTNTSIASSVRNLVEAFGKDKFLSKTSKDTAQQTIKFSMGLTVGDYVANVQGASIDKKGSAEVEDLKGRTSVVSPHVSTPDFVNNGLLGTGGGFYQLNGLTYAEFDYLTARRGMTVFELLIQEYRSIGGALIVSQANGEVENVALWTNEESGLSGYNLTIKDFANNPQFVVGDLVRCAKWDADNNAYIGYWVEVKAVYKDAGKISIWEPDLDGAVPQVGDKLVQMGNTTDTTRQGCIEVSTVNSLPRITIYDGITSPVITTDNIKSLQGALTGFVDPYTNEVLSGYGIWSDNAYLHGELVLSTGKSVTDTITESVNGISIGGRNLLVGTNQGTANWLLGSSIGTASYTISGSVAYQNYKGVSFVRNSFDTTPTYEVLFFPLRSELMEKDKTYHLSFDMLVTSDAVKFSVSFSTMQNGNPLCTPTIITHNGAGEYIHYDLEITATASGNDGITRYVYISTHKDFLGVWEMISIVNLKLEEGTKATAWTPAPEDADASISALSDKQAEFSVTLDGLTSTVTANKAEIDGTVTSLQSQITQNANAIALKVSQSDYDALEFSSPNLLLGSSARINANTFLLGSYNLGSDRPTEGELVTLSFSGYLGTGHGMFRIFNSGGTAPITSITFADKYNTSTKRFEKTFNWVVGTSANEYINIFQCDINGNRIDTGDYENPDRAASSIYDIKLERSSKPSAYNPSVEDGLLATGIDIVNKQVTVTADNFFVKNNAGQTTAAVDAFGNFKSSSLTALSADGSTNAMSVNLNNDKALKFYYSNGNVQMEIGWNGDSLIRYYDDTGDMLWKIGNEQGFIAPSDSDKLPDEIKMWKIADSTSDWASVLNSAADNVDHTANADTLYQGKATGMVATNASFATDTFINGYYTRQIGLVEVDGGYYWRYVTLYENGVAIDSKDVLFK